MLLAVLLSLASPPHVLLAQAPAAQDLHRWGASPLDDGARCDADAVRRANRHQLHEQLAELADTSFFRLIRVGLDGECPLGGEGGGEPACAGGEPGGDDDEHGGAGALCSLEGVPPTQQQQQQQQMPPFLVSGAAPVDRTISPGESRVISTNPSLSEKTCTDEETSLPEFWFDLCNGLVDTTASTDPAAAALATTRGGGSTSDGGMMMDGWINLQRNPERHTGYNGSEIWARMYEAACGFDEECHEERVLHRILSGLHASVNTHIARSFRGGTGWAPNPTFFMSSVGSHPDRIRNLNFAFVVLLRALRKASGVLSKVDFAFGMDPVEDARTNALMRRLLDSHLLSSCSGVFEAFDETLMFQGKDPAALKRKFKHAFRGISSLMNCVRCQKCRLHGKLQLAGVGTALKILMLSQESLEANHGQVLQREEIVAFINTLNKFSSAIMAVDELTELFLAERSSSSSSSKSTSASSSSSSSPLSESVPPRSGDGRKNDALDVAVNAVARAALGGFLTPEQEDTLLAMAAAPAGGSPLLAALARNYGSADPSRFARHALRLVLSSSSTEHDRGAVDVVVVGSGLAGTTTTLTLLERGARVVLVEKQGFLGGNSVYASSGMNAVDDSARRGGDSVQAFAQDMARSSGYGAAWAENPLVQALAEESEAAFAWATARAGVHFNKLGKLGGHSFPRTHRPEKGMAGAEMVYAMQHKFKSYEESGQLQVRLSTRVVGLFDAGVDVVEGDNKKKERISAKFVVLATGGYAAASPESGLLPGNLTRFGTTNGPFATGDGITLAVRDAGAGVVDLDKVQLHPTAFAQTHRAENDRLQGAQPLCAEILRGAGGILLDRQGKRFCDELGTRAYVSGEMLKKGQADYWILLNQDVAKEASHHVPAYERRGLLQGHDSIEDVAQAMGVSPSVLRAELEAYAALAEGGRRDAFGRSQFTNWRAFLQGARLYLGRVQPARHYCMGGLAVNAMGQVLSTAATEAGAAAGATSAPARPIPYLYAVGEVTGGIHGWNRLGGNGMTEGVVFGRRVGLGVPLGAAAAGVKTHGGDPVKPASKPVREITLQELRHHSHAKDCWVAIKGKVYDFTAFLSEHPAGPQAILDVAGRDGTRVYEEIHSMLFLEDFQEVGVLVG